jgi:hypothetical protein
MIDKEWQDGDDSKLFDDGYRQGVIDAYNYVVDELGFEMFDTSMLERLGVTPQPGELSDEPQDD